MNEVKNIPYQKLYNENGNIINQLGKGLNINRLPNRKQRRKLCNQIKNINKKFKP